MMTEKTLHPIRTVSKRTGLSAHVIRAWEKRYSAIEPERTGTNRRLYSDADIERLQLLKLATEGGRGIGHVANLPDDQLRELVSQDGAPILTSGSPGPEDQDEACHYHFEKSMAAVLDLDSRLLEDRLLQASVILSPQKLIEGVVVPLMVRLGEMWQQGTIRPAHEHIASAIVRTVLGNMANAYSVSSAAPLIVVSTPAGQVHEFGALAAAATAASEGWRLSYLGPNLPAEDIAAAAIQRNAQAVALSVVYPSDDMHVHGEVLRLRKLLPAETALLMGGRASSAYEDTVNRAGAVHVGNLAEFRGHLRKLRNQATGTTGRRKREAS
jgi:DNA-binding transcriptional MerR regulator/methylmalonyl-CoA mutase cobalamin-binding subunit